MSFISEPEGLFEIIYEICVNGYIPILAHPERYLFYADNFKMYFKLKKVGCLFQMNLLSSTDYYGRGVRQNLEKLLEKELIDFSGSDAHSLRHIEGFYNKIRLKDLKSLIKIIDNNNYFK